METTQKTKYQHAEAFSLITYLCDSCDGEEYLWNSRDGVTPFIIGCQKCGGKMSHVDWRKDLCIPELVPWKGLRFFADMTLGRYQEHKRKYVDKIWELDITGFGMAKDRYKDKPTMVYELCKDWDSNQPDIKTI